MNKNKGFSVIELMVVVAIVGIVTSMAVSSFSHVMQRNRLKATVEAFQSDMQFARTQALKRNRNVSISTKQSSTNPGDWCYGLTAVDTACDCSASPSDCEIKIVSGKEFKTISMYSPDVHNTFDFRRGTIILAKHVTFNGGHYAAQVKINKTGRALICIPKTADMPTDTIGLPSAPGC
jgi:type IV fimbrial biogenesis protein FimT